jgi:hypothetical protein
MNFLRSLVQSFKRMPYGMRGACAFLAFFSLFAPLSLLPVGMRVNDVPVGVVEFWRSGGGPIFFCFGAISAFTLFGFVAARRWSRFLFVLIVGLMTVGAALLQTPRQTETLAVAALLCSLAAWYAFYRRTVRVYFHVSHENAA